MNMSEEIEIWRPVKAKQLNNGLYKITSTPTLDDKWEFVSGQTVKCATKTFADGKSGLIAIENA